MVLLLRGPLASLCNNLVGSFIDFFVTRSHISVSLTTTALQSVAAPRATFYLPVLTGVRAIAAYLVYMHHFNPFRSETEGLLRRIPIEMHVGVPVFFVLSGFLITLRYADQTNWTLGSWANYMRNRAARIYPMYFLFTCIAFAAGYYFRPTIDWNQWWYSITMLRGFFEEYKFSGVGQGWTLTVEETFYFIAPIVFMVVQRRPKALWLIALLLVGLGFLLVRLLSPLQYHGLFGNVTFMLLFTLFGRAIEFFAGIQLAFWFRAGHLQAPGRSGGYTLGGIIAIAGAIAALVSLQGHGYDYGQEHPWGIFINNVVLPGAIVLWFTGLLTEDTWLRRLLSSRPLQVLGKSSYLFYLIHMGFIQELVAHHITGHLLGQFVVLNVLAIGLYYGLEEPLHRLLRARRVPRVDKAELINA